jgi:hypothetical protein
MSVYYRQDGAPAGGGAAGAGAAGGGTSGTIIPLDQQAAAAKTVDLEKENATLKQRNQQLEGQFKEGTKKLEELHATIVSPEYLQFIASRGKGGKGEGGQGGGQQQPQGPSAEELNQMDNAELVGYIGNIVKQSVEAAVKPVASATEQVNVQSQVRAAAERFKDFWSYRGSMVQIAERMPHLDPTGVYLMVKGLEASTGKNYKDAASDSGDQGGSGGEASKRDERRPASGEFGTGPGSSLGGTREREATTYGQAAGDAYDAIFGRG